MPAPRSRPLVATATPTRAPQRVASPRFTVQWLPPYKVVVHDNDYNTFDEVIGILMRAVPGMTLGQAVEHAYRIHEIGSTVPYTGLLDAAETVAQTIRTIGIQVTVEPDVSAN